MRDEEAERRAEREFSAAEAEGNWPDWEGEGDPPWWLPGARYVSALVQSRGIPRPKVGELARSIFEERLRSYGNRFSVLRRLEESSRFVAYCEAYVSREMARRSAASDAAIRDVVNAELRVPEAERVTPRNGDSEATSQPATVVNGDTSRTETVNAFLLGCNRKSDLNVKVKKKHIWLAVGHKSPRQFQYWQAESEKATAEDDRNFLRILGMSPADFRALLTKKGIV